MLAASPNWRLCSRLLYLCWLLADIMSPSRLPALQLFECLAASTASMTQQNEDAEAELRELGRGELRRTQGAAPPGELFRRARPGERAG